MPKLLISYRRADAALVTYLCEGLRTTFGQESVFLDVDYIQIGLSFREAIDEAVGACDVVLAIIGPDWFGWDAERKHKRIDKPTDLLRLELEAALRRNIPVVPILVDNTAMPDATELADGLKPIAHKHAYRFRSGANSSEDRAALIQSLNKLFPSEFDVFISAKSSDYAGALKVYQFLVAEGLSVFFSHVTLPNTGRSDYRQQIDLALEGSRHFILVSSSRSNIESGWVQAELDLFINEKRAGRKGGAIFTLMLDDLRIEQLPITLRSYEAWPLNDKSLQKLALIVQPHARKMPREESLSNTIQQKSTQAEIQHELVHEKDSLSATEKQWFAIIEGVSRGPFSDSSLKAMFENGTIDRKTPLWSQPMLEWRIAEELLPGLIRVGLTTEDSKLFKGLPTPCTRNDSFLFVSYSRHDSSQLIAILDQLEKWKVPFWYDRGIHAGGKWDSEIADRIKNCLVFMVVLTHSSIRSKWVTREIRRADKLDKPIIPIMIDDIDLSGGIGMILDEVQMLQLGSPEFDSHFRDSLRTCSKESWNLP